MLRNNQQQYWRSTVQPLVVWCTAQELARSPALASSNSSVSFLIDVQTTCLVAYLSIFFVIVVQTSHWVYTFLMAGTLCLCLFSSHACQVNTFESGMERVRKWEIDSFPHWERILQGGRDDNKPDTQIPAGGYRQSQGGSALPSRSSKPEIWFDGFWSCQNFTFWI